MNNIKKVIRECIPGVVQKSRGRIKENRNNKRFHFVTDKMMASQIDDLRKKLGLRFSRIFKLTGKLFLMIIELLGEANYRVSCLPGSAGSSGEVMDCHFNFKLTAEMYRKLKFSHVTANSFSMAQILRIYFLVLFRLLEDYTFSQLLAALDEAYSKLRRQLKILNKRLKRVQLNPETSVESIFFILFDKLCYPIYTETG